MKSCMSDLSSLRTGGPRCEGPSSNPGLTACIAKGVAICPPHSWVATAAMYQELGFHQARCGIGFPHACCHTTAHELWLLAASAPSGCAHRCTSPGQSRVGLQGCEDIMHKISKANVHSASLPHEVFRLHVTAVHELAPEKIEALGLSCLLPIADNSKFCVKGTPR